MAARRRKKAPGLEDIGRELFGQFIGDRDPLEVAGQVAGFVQARMAERAAASSDPVVADAHGWAARFVEASAPRWRQFIAGAAMTNRRCEHGGCSAVPFAACGICQRAHCLEHALHSQAGESMCLHCANAAATMRGQRPAPSPGVSSAALRVQHLTALGLDSSASLEDVRRRWKKLVSEHHPDRARPHEQAAATRRFVDLKKSYEWLIEHGEARAA